MVLPINNAVTAPVPSSSSTTATASNSATTVSPEVASIVIAYNTVVTAQNNTIQVDRDLGELGQELQRIDAQMSDPNADVTQFQVTAALTLEQQLAEVSRQAAFIAANSSPNLVNLNSYNMTTVFSIGGAGARL